MKKKSVFFERFLGLMRLYLKNIRFTYMKKLLQKAKSALETEILAVQRFPSKEIIQPSQIKPVVGSTKVHVIFDHFIPSLRFTEECTAHVKDQNIKARLLDFSEKQMTIELDEFPSDEQDSFELEWENDFVLKRTKEKLEQLDQKSQPGLLEALFSPQQFCSQEAFETEVYHDDNRNQAQEEAIEKALNQPVSFVWGPPGTGKTSTLGYIAANFLLHEKTVLLVSNTNRAVDISLLSVYDALSNLGEDDKSSLLTRFGDIALDNPILNKLSFKNHIELVSEKKKQKASELSQQLERFEEINSLSEKLLSENESIPEQIEIQLTFLQSKIEELGGIKLIQEKIEISSRIHEHYELGKFHCIATTLAKVCTSDLLETIYFDAVIVDEASMANLPYLMVMASKASSHMVLVGDPMQLPPISITDNEEHKAFLEKDIFTFISNAETVNELFQWHDSFPYFTSFFDTQYRLNADLANLVSSTFYEGRLKTKGKFHIQSQNSSFAVVDSSPFSPSISKKSGDGFRPINSIHVELSIQLLRNWIRYGFKPDEIGIIVPFRSVLWDYKKQLQQNGFHDVEIGTVHTFQGREKPVILFDTVMSGEASSSSHRHYTVRPFDEIKSGMQVPRLLNVAFSRSKDLFVVLADMNHIQKAYRNRFLNNLLTTMIDVQNPDQKIIDLTQKELFRFKN